MQPFFTENSTSISYESSHVVSDEDCRLFGCTGYNSGPEQYIQFHDAATLPNDGAIPKIVIRIPSQNSFSLDYSSIGRHFKFGIVICNSSTAVTKTIGDADCFYDVQYRNDD